MRFHQVPADLSVQRAPLLCARPQGIGGPNARNRRRSQGACVGDTRDAQEGQGDRLSKKLSSEHRLPLEGARKSRGRNPLALQVGEIVLPEAIQVPLMMLWTALHPCRSVVSCDQEERHG